MLLELAKNRRDEVAIDEGDRTRTFGELADRVTRLARFLRQEVGLGPREHYSLLMGNCLEAAELILGGIASSQWVTPINWHLAEEEIELKRRFAQLRQRRLAKLGKLDVLADLEGVAEAAAATAEAAAAGGAAAAERLFGLFKNASKTS